VAEIADRVTVMYLGIVAEECAVDDLFHDPKHPYTKALLRSVPTVGPRAHRRLATIHGIVPHPYNRPTGCPFHARCDEAMQGRCDVEVPPVLSDAERSVRCLLYESPEDLRPVQTSRSA
jgi:peptide/nickel transport system ATP-binding protein